MIQVFVAGIHAQGQWVSLALVCPYTSQWIYLERVDASQFAPAPPLRSDEPKNWGQALFKVPTTEFVRTQAELLTRARKGITLLAAGVPGARTAQLLLRLHPSVVDLASELNLPFAPVQSDPETLPEFRKQAFGRGQHPGEHPLIAALEAAACEQHDGVPLQLEDISSVELLFGTKNAQSLRAWLRDRARAHARREAAGSPTPAAAAV